MSTSEKSAAPRRVRTGTVVWGAVILVVAALILVSLLTDIRFDLGIVFLGLLLGAGLALVIGGISSMTRRQSAAGLDDTYDDTADVFYDSTYDAGIGGGRNEDDRYDGDKYDGVKDDRDKYNPKRNDTGSTGL